MKRLILLIVILIPLATSAKIPAMEQLGNEAEKQTDVEYFNAGSVMLGMAQTFANKEQRATFKMLDNIDMIINAGISLLIGLADGLIVALPKLIDKIPVIIDKLVTALSNNGPRLLSAGVQLIVKLAGGLIQAIPQLVSKIPQIISSIVNGLKNGISGIKDVGKDLIKGLWNGISNMTSWIKDKIKGFGDSVVNGLKDFFGIKSPSRLMADVVGKNIALGIGKGFEDNIGPVNDEITSAMNFDSANVNVNGRGNSFGGIGGGVTVYQTNHYSQAHSRYELYKTKQQTAAAVRLALAGGVRI